MNIEKWYCQVCKTSYLTDNAKGSDKCPTCGTQLVSQKAFFEKNMSEGKTLNLILE